VFGGVVFLWRVLLRGWGGGLSSPAAMVAGGDSFVSDGGVTSRVAMVACRPRCQRVPRGFVTGGALSLRGSRGLVLRGALSFGVGRRRVGFGNAMHAMHEIGRLSFALVGG